ncbi:MAG: DUF1961 family protein [Cyclobacteriaceae bacterium]
MNFGLISRFSILCCIACTPFKPTEVEPVFQSLNGLDWKVKFSDSCTDDWNKSWFLDGKKATIDNSELGMYFYAGPIAQDPAHHAVLWTKESFEGDLKIEYEYTRLDSSKQFVTILYLLTTGSDRMGFDKDISKWSNHRETPYMRRYFNSMNSLHISYAAFGIKLLETPQQYLRARRYRPDLKQGLKGTDLGAFDLKKFFETGVKHYIQVIKKDRKILMKITNDENSRVFIWHFQDHPQLTAGIVGLRHMATRGALYKNIRIYQLE